MGQEVQNRRNKQSKHSGVEAIPIGTSLQELIELSLRDQILELEEKIFLGNLGKLNVASRDEWLAAITNKNYAMGAESLSWGEGERTEAETLAEEESGVVQQLAAAVLQLGQMISEQDKYLKQPLGEDEKEKKKKEEKEKESDEDEDEDQEEEAATKVVM